MGENRRNGGVPFGRAGAGGLGPNWVYGWDSWGLGPAKTGWLIHIYVIENNLIIELESLIRIVMVLDTGGLR